MAGLIPKQTGAQASTPPTPASLKRNASVRSPLDEEADNKKSKADQFNRSDHDGNPDSSLDIKDDSSDPLYIPPGQSHSLPRDLLPPLKDATSTADVGEPASIEMKQPAVTASSRSANVDNMNSKQGTASMTVTKDASDITPSADGSNDEKLRSIRQEWNRLVEFGHQR